MGKQIAKLGIRPEDLKEKIENKLQEIEGNYQFMIHVDQSYVPV